MPPGSDSNSTRKENAKLAAIKSLIDVIQNTEINNVQYNISNSTNDDVLYVKIPLPNLKEEQEENGEETKRLTNVVEIRTNADFKEKPQQRTQKSLLCTQDVQVARGVRKGVVTRTTKIKNNS